MAKMTRQQEKAMFANHGLKGASKETLRKMLLDNKRFVNTTGQIGKQSRQLDKLIKKKLAM